MYPWSPSTHFHSYYHQYAHLLASPSNSSQWFCLVTVSRVAPYLHRCSLILIPFFAVDANSVIEQAREHPHRKHLGSHSRSDLHQTWSRDEDAATVPKYQLPDVGIPSRSAYQLLHDEMNLDGNPTLNLASFVHTWMPEEATKLIMETINK